MRDWKYDTRTEGAIRSALLGLLAEKPLADVTVAELCRQARVSRSTFYEHFGNVSDVYDAIVEDFATGLSPVMAALCMGVHADRAFDMKPAGRIAELAGLTEKQVSRGVAELRRLDIIVPVTRKAEDGARHIDRSRFGHVATYCFTRDAWRLIEDGFKSREQQVGEGELEAQT